MPAQSYGLCFIICKALYAKILGVERFTLNRRLPLPLDLSMAKNIGTVCMRSRNRLLESLWLLSYISKPNRAKTRLVFRLFSPPKDSWNLLNTKVCKQGLHGKVARHRGQVHVSRMGGWRRHFGVQTEDLLSVVGEITALTSFPIVAVFCWP